MMALMNCPECRASVSDKARACPHCGVPLARDAAAAPAQPGAQAAPADDGVVCPFSGHAIPAGASVCLCGAYYGYKGGVLDDQKFKLLLRLLGASVLLALLGYGFEWSLALLVGGLGSVVFGVVFLFFVLPIRLQGKRWWRQM